MQKFPCGPHEIFRSVWINRTLIGVLIKREVLGRYKGSVFGILWSLLNPVLMLVVYTFVFGVVFKVRWDGNGVTNAEFALILFAGLIIFNLFSECLNRSSGLILNNPNYVKKVIFPLEILPVVSLGSALFHALISCGVWLIAYIILNGVPHPTIFLMPLVFIPLVFFILGITWFFAAISVYLRDTAQMLGVITTVLMFMSPIFYPISSLPEGIRRFLKFNPLTPIIEQSREVLYWGIIPNFFDYGLCVIWSFMIFIIGFVTFQTARKGFADVI